MEKHLKIGYTSEIESTPLSSIIRRITVINHDGTPDILVTSATDAFATSAGSFSSQSASNAVFLSGTLTKFASGLIFINQSGTEITYMHLTVVDAKCVGK